MSRFGRRDDRAADASTVEDDEVVRDAEQSLVAALQESDTALEAMHDSDLDDPSAVRDRRWRIGFAGAALALLGIMVARRRR